MFYLLSHLDSHWFVVEEIIYSRPVSILLKKVFLLLLTFNSFLYILGIVV